MAEQTRTPHHPHQIFSTLYGLNKLFTKKIIVGLEYDNFKDEYYQPVVRLLGTDFDGIAFSYNDWQEFKSSFTDIEKYFKGHSEELMDQKIYGSCWTLKFTRSHQDKAIEIEENRRPATPGLVRRYRQSIVMKRVTFDCLDEFVAKCIDSRLEYLNSVAGVVSCIASEVVEFIVNKGSFMHEAQITIYTPDIVKNVINTMDESAIEMITTSVESRTKELKNQTVIGKNDVTDVIYQIVSLHLYNIIDILNKKM